MLEPQLEAAAGSHFEGLLGVVVEVVVVQPATGRSKWERARAHATHPWAKEGVAAVHAGGAGVGGSGEGAGAAASKQRALCMCSLCVGAAPQSSAQPRVASHGAPPTDAGAPPTYNWQLP